MRIEKGVPAPGPQADRSIKYPFREMEVGDSVFFPGESRGSQSNPATAAYIHGGHTGKKFTARKEGDGVRIWRIE